MPTGEDVAHLRRLLLMSILVLQQSCADYPCQQNDYLCACVCINKTKPCFGACPLGRWLCDDVCIRHGERCHGSCVNDLYVLSFTLNYEQIVCIPKAEAHRCGPIYIPKHWFCLAECQGCPTDFVLTKEPLRCAEINKEIWLCHGQYGLHYECVVNCTPITEACISFGNVTYCPPRFRLCQDLSNNSRCVGPDEVCDQACGPDYIYCRDCDCCRPSASYHECNGSCTLRSAPCDGVCSKPDQLCPFDPPCTTRERHYCAAYDMPCNSTCRKGFWFCGNLCINISTPCLSECFNGFKCGDSCKENDKREYFYGCDELCLPSEVPCKNQCNPHSNLLKVCGDRCVKPELDVYECFGKCVHGDELCDGECRNDSLWPCAVDVDIKCQHKAKACQNDCFSDDYWFCNGFCIPNSQSCDGKCESSSDLTKVCDKWCVKESEALSKCRGKCLPSFLACAGKCPTQRLVLCRTNGSDFCIARSLPCNGRCPREAYRCFNQCLLLNESCDGKCLLQGQWDCKGRCQNLSKPCGGQCPEPLVLLNGVCSRKCSESQHQCYSQCINVTQPCAGKCLASQQLCGNMCLPLDGPCDGKCAEDQWICLSKCINNSEPCLGKCSADRELDSLSGQCQLPKSSSTCLRYSTAAFINLLFIYLLPLFVCESFGLKP